MLPLPPFACVPEARSVTLPVVPERVHVRFAYAHELAIVPL